MRAPPRVLALMALAACADRPSDRQLEAWRSEARAANQAAFAAAAQGRGDEAGRALRIAGQTRIGITTLPWDELNRVATTHVLTVSPHNTADPDRAIDFRGVLVRDLLDRVGVAEGVTELTFVSIDAFRSAVSVADARRFRMLLAIEADGAPIPRSGGGPIFLVHPHSDSPEARTLFPDRFWSFYVTDLIVGTEPARIAVGDRVVDGAALAKLPPDTLIGPVKYRVYWPSGDVRLRGVRVRDVLAAAGATVPAGGSVVVRGKAPIHRDPASPRRIAGDDLDRCPAILATHWAEIGFDDAPIPARLGGPVALAVGPGCGDRYGDTMWLPFVEELVVEAAP